VLAAMLIASLDLAAIATEIERANFRGDETSLEACRRLLSDAVAAERADGAALYRYTLAYVDYRLATLARRGSKEAERYLSEAEKELERLLEARPDDAEAQALYGTVNGNLITGMWSGMRRGPRAGAAYERARALAPENPRVVMQEGVSRLFRPKFAGGGVDQARRDLTRALELFAKEPPDSPWPNWGGVEIYAWLGYTAMKEGDDAAAREYLEKALSLEPEYAWVKESLLPELKAREKSRND
jgi:Flp pilus assembly protein TadD